MASVMAWGSSDKPIRRLAVALKSTRPTRAPLGPTAKAFATLARKDWIFRNASQKQKSRLPDVSATKTRSMAPGQATGGSGWARTGLETKRRANATDRFKSVGMARRLPWERRRPIYPMYRQEWRSALGNFGENPVECP